MCFVAVFLTIKKVPSVHPRINQRTPLWLSWSTAKMQRGHVMVQTERPEIPLPGMTLRVVLSRL